MSQSEFREIASKAPDYIEDMFFELITSTQLDNRVCLGTMIACDSEIQVQLVITRNPDDMIED